MPSERKIRILPNDDSLITLSNDVLNYFKYHKKSPKCDNGRMSLYLAREVTMSILGRQGKISQVIASWFKLDQTHILMHHVHS